MFCRHLLLRTMLPSGAQRLLGLETASVSPLSSLSSQHSCSSDLYVSQRTLRRLCSPPVTQFSCLGLGVHHSLHTRTGIQVDFTSCHKQSKTIHVPANHTLSQELHTGSSNRCGRSSTTKRHPLLGTQCTLSDVQPTRFLAFSTKAILEASPPSFQPYLRLIRFDKPIGTMLLLWPCTWSIALAATPGHLPDARMLALFGAGAFFMRGAGCIINDMWDSDFDKKVERTKLRPLASGELTHFQALVFLASQLSISLGILLQLNTYSILLGAASMILVVLYPLAKRFTYWPQLMLGVTLNWGVLLAWSALKGSLEWPVAPLYLACVLYTMFYDTIYSHQGQLNCVLKCDTLCSDKNWEGFTFNYGALLGWSAVRGACEWSVCLPLYAAGIMWTLIYDTIYAHQDKYDDMLIGVKSSALKLGDQTKPCLAVFSTVMISCLTATGVMCDQTWPYFAGVGLTAAHLAHQLYTVDLNNADECAAKFRANSKLGLVLFLSIVAANLLRKETPAGDDAQKTDTVTD